MEMTWCNEKAAVRLSNKTLSQEERNILRAAGNYMVHAQPRILKVTDERRPVIVYTDGGRTITTPLEW
eukprot:5205970-Amphidinium_carterae.2